VFRRARFLEDYDLNRDNGKQWVVGDHHPLLRLENHGEQTPRRDFRHTGEIRFKDGRHLFGKKFSRSSTGWG
jgi:hypothetical protein